MSDSMNEMIGNASKAGLILQGISQAIHYVNEEATNARAVSNWLSLIDAAVSEANRLITGFPLGWEGGAVTVFTVGNVEQIEEMEVTK